MSQEQTTHDYHPRVLSDEEIDMYLSGDRREVDRLILYSINRVSAALLEHMRGERERDKNIQNIGGFEEIALRAKFVDSLILQSEKRNRMMEKVESSGVLWAFILFLSFLGAAAWEYVKGQVNK